jgi:glyoxylase-like metal-dependent hydrolase (beta-lactamase superfamily II)
VSERTATIFDVTPAEGTVSIHGIDTVTGGLREFNSVYLLPGGEPTLVEAASAADTGVVIEALDRLGIGPHDLAHIVVTHVHLDHAGGAGTLAERFPHATVWVHERGAPHLADPTRLVASTARTYGEERMFELYGRTVPVDSERIRAVEDGDDIALGDRHLEVLHTPGHASHHIALLESATGAMFTGEAVGSHLPWADCYRPALPAPEVDVELALAAVERIRACNPHALLTSHFGPIPDAQEGCARGADRIRAWSDTVRDALTNDPATDLASISTILTEQAGREYLQDAGVPIDLPRYDAIGSIAMNAGGLARYWRRRWEREAGESTVG